MPNDLGLPLASGGGIGYKLLQDLLARRFAEEQSAHRQANELAQLGLQRDKLGEDQRQFDVNTNRLSTEFATTEDRQNREFGASAPVRIAQARNLHAEADRSNWQISDTKRTADRTDDLIRIRAEGDQRARVAGIRVPTGLTPNQVLTQTRALQGDYRKVTSAANEMQRQLGVMDDGLAAARRGDLNAGSQAVLVTFQKILDPNSVVRESEYARSPEGLGLMQKIEGFLPRLAQGGPGVPAAELEKFATLARQMTEGVTRNAQAQAQSIVDLATAHGIDPKLVTGSGGTASATSGSSASDAAKRAADLIKKYGGR